MGQLILVVMIKHFKGAIWIDTKYFEDWLYGYGNIQSDIAPLCSALSLATEVQYRQCTVDVQGQSSHKSGKVNRYTALNLRRLAHANGLIVPYVHSRYDETAGEVCWILTFQLPHTFAR